jgi:diguanylate cyclase (GGDEF)-like protein
VFPINTTLVDISAETPTPERRRPEYAVDACLIVVQGRNQGHIHWLSAASMRIGRDYTADITIEDLVVSRTQASVEVDADSVHIVDGGSRNGTFVNGMKLASGQALRLQRNDLVRMGGTELKFLPRGDREAYYMRTLEMRAQLDPLTKIYNKGYLLEEMEGEFARARVHATELGILVIDLDKFKLVNDTFGHDVGDQILVFATGVLSRVLSQHSTIFGRFGGEEFVVIVSGTTREEALELAEALRHVLGSDPATVGDKSIPVTCSIGVAWLEDATKDVQALFRSADQALYRAKSLGRNRVESSI